MAFCFPVKIATYLISSFYLKNISLGNDYRKEFAPWKLCIFQRKKCGSLSTHLRTALHLFLSKEGGVTPIGHCMCKGLLDRN
jgi:hypothetical protein